MLKLLLYFKNKLFTRRKKWIDGSYVPSWLMSHAWSSISMS